MEDGIAVDTSLSSEWVEDDNNKVAETKLCLLEREWKKQQLSMKKSSSNGELFTDVKTLSASFCHVAIFYQNIKPAIELFLGSILKCLF